MTYGWAILIIIVVVAALYGMGVFTAKGGVPCSPCFGYFAYVDHDTTKVIFTNGARDIDTIGCAIGTTTGAMSPTSASAGDSLTCTIVIADGNKVEVTYTVVGGVSHTDTATLHEV